MTPPFSCTLADVAREAGVATSTASMALRGDPRIRRATRDRVKKAAESLEYRADPVLSALVARRNRSKPHRTFANLVALIDDRWGVKTQPTWLVSLVAGMRTACARLGYTLDALHIRRDLASHKHPGRMLDSRGVRGIVLLPPKEDNVNLPIDLASYSVIAVGNQYQDRPLHRVGSNAHAAIDMACTRLLAAGYRRIALADSLASERRLRFEWLGGISKELFLARYGERILHPYLPPRFDEPEFLDWVRTSRPDGIITNDLPVYSCLTRAGFRVPGDIGVVYLSRDFHGHGDAAGANPSGIVQHLDLVGEAAIEHLHLLLLRGERGYPDVPREVLVYPGWTDGATIRTSVGRGSADGQVS